MGHGMAGEAVCSVFDSLHGSSRDSNAVCRNAGHLHQADCEKRLVLTVCLVPPDFQCLNRRLDRYRPASLCCFAEAAGTSSRSVAVTVRDGCVPIRHWYSIKKREQLPEVCFRRLPTVFANLKCFGNLDVLTAFFAIPLNQ